MDIGIKFALRYACTFKGEIKTKFLQTQEFQPLVCSGVLTMFSLFESMFQINF